MWAVHVTVTRVSPRDGWTSTRPLPTFYLDETVQGIVSPEGAEAVAREIVAPFHRPNETVIVFVHKVIEPEPAPEGEGAAWDAGHRAGAMWEYTQHTDETYSPDANPHKGVRA